MNRGTLPIVARLQALQAPARLAPGGARVVAEVGHPNPLAALLRAVNETMLSRSLTFESSMGTSLTLDVAGRRVLRLTGVSGISGAESCLAAPALEDEHKDELIKLLQAVAVPRHELRVVSGPVGRESDGMSVGIPVALLADLCLIELNETAQAAPEPEQEPAPEPEPEPEAAPAPPAKEPEFTTGDETFLPALALRMGPALAAWLIQGGAENGRTGGAEEMVAHLSSWLEDEAEAVSRQLDMVSMVPAGPVCIVLGATLVDGHSIICARADSGVLLGVIEGDASQSLLKAWNAVRG